MFHRLSAVFALGALVAFAVSPVPAVSAAKPNPAPTATPLKTISHVRTSPLCSGLRRIIGPAIGKVLQNDKLIDSSKPFFKDYVRSSTSGLSQGSTNLAVAHLEGLVGPLVKNTQAIDKLLNDPYAFPKVAYSDDDQKLLQMRKQLQTVNEQQKKALDLISGFVDTEQLSQLQAEGKDLQDVLRADPNHTGRAGATPTPPPAGILDAGVNSIGNDPARGVDPRFKASNSVLANPLNAFGEAISYYQQDIQSSEQVAAKSVIEAVPLCGGHVPGAPVASPSPTPSP